MRKVIGIAAVLFLLLPLAVPAETFNQAVVKAIDYERNAITVTVGGKDMTFPIHKDAKTTTQQYTKIGVQELPADIYAVQAGEMITVTVEKSGQKDVVKSLKVSPDRYYGKRSSKDIFLDLPIPK